MPAGINRNKKAVIKVVRFLIGICCLSPGLLLFGLVSFSHAEEDAAKVLFENRQAYVFQVKVIDKGSGNKSSIGSGFLIDSEGTIATNYHVVSDYILEPDQYRVEILDHNNNLYPVEILNFDVIHDLALIRSAEVTSDAFFIRQDRQLAKGERIFSLGNPHDLGMVIIEGNYNGLVEGSRYEKYLFSGSLNGGMSGGPALDRDGQVIGINVSKGGEQLSFLVPVKHLNELIAKAADENGVVAREDYKTYILTALLEDQDAYFSDLLDKDWPVKDFQNYTLPDKIDASLKCWGHTVDKEEKKYNEIYRYCRTEDEIYISGDLYTGRFSYYYGYLDTDELNRVQFYNLLQENFETGRFRNGYEGDTTNFICHDDTTLINDSNWKVTTCIREYVDYRGIYDTALIATSIDQSHAALTVHIKMQGIDRNNIKNMHNKFLREIVWKQ